MSALADALIARVREADTESGDDLREFVEHVTPLLLGELARAFGKARFRRLLDRELPGEGVRW